MWAQDLPHVVHQVPVRCTRADVNRCGDADALSEFLHSELLQQLVALPDAELADALVTDVYKPRMHKVRA